MRQGQCEEYELSVVFSLHEKLNYMHLIAIRFNNYVIDDSN